LVWAYYTEKNSSSTLPPLHEAEAAEIQMIPKSAKWSSVEIIGGLILLIAGSQVLLKGAVGIASGLGISQAMIGLTLVAVGTSLPELTISVIAALRKHTDVAVGNVLGSNIFNLLGILGISAIVQPMEIKGRVAAFDQWVMLGVTLLLYVFLFTGRRLGRIEGGFLLLGYVSYIGISYLYFSH
jgi:cation:H+ antiporter